MNVESLVEAVSAGVGAAAIVGTSMRSYWTRREARQQAAFRRAVQQIVDESMAEVLGRQTEFERRQGRHLDRQDETLRRLGLLITRLSPPPRPGEIGAGHHHDG